MLVKMFFLLLILHSYSRRIWRIYRRIEPIEKTRYSASFFTRGWILTPKIPTKKDAKAARRISTLSWSREFDSSMANLIILMGIQWGLNCHSGKQISAGIPCGKKPMSKRSSGERETGRVEGERIENKTYWSSRWNPVGFFLSIVLARRQPCIECLWLGPLYFPVLCFLLVLLWVRVLWFFYAVCTRLRSADSGDR